MSGPSAYDPSLPPLAPPPVHPALGSEPAVRAQFQAASTPSELKAVGGQCEAVIRGWYWPAAVPDEAPHGAWLLAARFGTAIHPPFVRRARVAAFPHLAANPAVTDPTVVEGLISWAVVRLLGPHPTAHVAAQMVLEALARRGALSGAHASVRLLATTPALSPMAAHHRALFALRDLPTVALLEIAKGPVGRRYAGAVMSHPACTRAVVRALLRHRARGVLAAVARDQGALTDPGVRALLFERALSPGAYLDPLAGADDTLELVVARCWLAEPTPDPESVRRVLHVAPARGVALLEEMPDAWRSRLPRAVLQEHLRDARVLQDDALRLRAARIRTTCAPLALPILDPAPEAGAVDQPAGQRITGTA